MEIKETDYNISKTVNGKAKKTCFFVDTYFVDNHYNMKIHYFYKSFAAVHYYYYSYNKFISFFVMEKSGRS